jgi:hypothetical protein
VGRNIVATFTETMGFSDSVETKLTKEQVSIIKKVERALKRELAKKELESVTINFGIISFTIKNKEKT